MIVESQKSSFPRSAWERKSWPLRGRLLVRATQSVEVLRSHAERGNEAVCRRAITLTEVLIAMGILTVGLLGVASIFPVASYYMQRAEVADNGSAIAQSVMSDIMARGMLNPRSWFVMVPLSRSTAAPAWARGDWNLGYRADSKYTPAPSAPRAGTFTRPVVETMADAIWNAHLCSDPASLSKQFGGAFVIDPMGVGAMAFPDASTGAPHLNVAAAAFPASAPETYNVYSTWSTWSSWGLQWPVRRTTFVDPRTGWQMGPATAEHFFRGSDDLALELPDRDDRPAITRWESPNGVPLARQWTGDYSWLVTLTPTTSAALKGIATSPESHAYEVSVVVFYKRPLPPSALTVYSQALTSPDGANDTFLDEIGANERSVKAKIISTGLNGGEILLEDLLDGYTDDESSNPAAYPNKSPFNNLKVGQWVMLCGPHPNTTTVDPRFVLKWYQVVSIETSGAGLTIDPVTQRLITVRGAQWPWQPATDLDDETQISNGLCVGICRGAVAVHTKTLRLEKSSVIFGTGGSPTAKPNDNTLSGN